MALLVDASVWEAGVYQLETTDPVQGGAGGIDNVQPQQLANRSKWLKDRIEAIVPDTTHDTLAAGVTKSSLTQVGVLVAPHMTSPVVNSGGITVTAGTSSLQAVTFTTATGSGVLTITSGGIAVTGNSTITGTLGGISTVTATTFVGALTGNASSANILATARAINGVNFDGSGPITVTAAAGTLTGATLNATVTASSLTTVGVLASPHMTGAVVDSGGFTVTIGTSSLQAITGTTLILSGALTYGGVTLSGAVTGTGNMVLSANCTFTGTTTVGGVLTLGAGTTSGAASGEVVLPNALYVRAANSAASSTVRLIGITAGNVVSIDPSGNGVAFGADVSLRALATTAPVTITTTDQTTCRLALVNNGVGGKSIALVAGNVNVDNTGVTLWNATDGVKLALWTSAGAVTFPSGGVFNGVLATNIGQVISPANDANHGMIYSATVDGPEIRGFAGIIFKKGAAGVTELGRWVNTGLTVVGGVTAGNGLSVSSGTTAVQAFTATTIAATGPIGTTGVTSATMALDTTTGATSDNNAIFFKRGGAIKWRVGNNVTGTNVDAFNIYNDALGNQVLAFADATGVASFTSAVFAPYARQSAGTSGVLAAGGTEDITAPPGVSWLFVQVASAVGVGGSVHLFAVYSVIRDNNGIQNATPYIVVNENGGIFTVTAVSASQVRITNTSGAGGFSVKWGFLRIADSAV